MKYLCAVCGYIYDPLKGDPDNGIAPGTPFENIPNEWVCPICGVSKNDFIPYEENITLKKVKEKDNSSIDRTKLKYNEIVPNVYAFSSKHWDRELFDELIPLPDGTSYNAYFIDGGSKTALIDSVDPEKYEDLIDFLTELDVSKIDYIIANHAEQDHSGAIPFLLDIYPDAKVVTNEKGKELLIDHLDLPDDVFKIIKDGEELKVGNKTLRFIFTPWVHWPETISTYLVEDKILFSCDFFGSHRATSSLFVEDEYKVIEDAKRYYAEIMMPFRAHIVKNIEKIENLEIKYIAPSHGPVYNKPSLIINAYKDWISSNVENKVLIPYVSMHYSTYLLVDYIVKSLTAHNIKVIPMNLTKVDIGQFAIELVDASTIIFAAPQVLGGAHPKAVYAAYLANALRPKAKFYSIIGSYGWGGKMVDQFKNLLANLKATYIEGILIKGIPKDKDIEGIDNFVKRIVEAQKSL